MSKEEEREDALPTDEENLKVAKMLVQASELPEEDVIIISNGTALLDIKNPVSAKLLGKTLSKVFCG